MHTFDRQAQTHITQQSAHKFSSEPLRRFDIGKVFVGLTEEPFSMKSIVRLPQCSGSATPKHPLRHKCKLYAYDKHSQSKDWGSLSNNNPPEHHHFNTSHKRVSAVLTTTKGHPSLSENQVPYPVRRGLEFPFGHSDEEEVMASSRSADSLSTSFWKSSSTVQSSATRSFTIKGVLVTRCYYARS